MGSMQIRGVVVEDVGSFAWRRESPNSEEKRERKTQKGIEEGSGVAENIGDGSSGLESRMDRWLRARKQHPDFMKLAS